MKYKDTKNIIQRINTNGANRSISFFQKLTNLVSRISNNKETMFVLILALPAILVWVFSLIAYVWQYISINWFSKFPSQVYLMILLLMPFISFNFSLWFYFKTKQKRYKNLSMINMILLILIIVSSVLFEV